MATQFNDLETLTLCPVCGASEPFNAAGRNLSRCPRCQVYFVNPRPTQAEIIEHYNSGVTFDEWETKQKDDRDRVWRRRLDLLGPARSRTLLDMGCGDGYFLSMAREKGFKVMGTEASEAGGRRAEAKGHEVLFGQFCEVDFGDRKFDVITLWHVLEHVPNPGEVLAKAHALLNAQGTLAIALPNEDNYFVKARLGARLHELGMDFGEEIHLTFFQPSTLRRALEKFDFHVKAFGVDDPGSGGGSKEQLVRQANRFLNALTGWHCDRCMYAISTAV